MRSAFSRALAGLAAATAFGAVPAAAQSAQNAAADAAIACLDIENVEERLVCLEAAAKELKATRVVIEEEAVASPENATGASPVDQKTLEDSFGAEGLAETKREKREEQQKFKLTAKVVEFRINPYKDITAVLDNGQIWQQLSGDSTTVHIPPGDKLYTVTIKRGPLNNYRMRIDQMERWIRVRRLK